MIVQPDFLDHWKTQSLIAATGDPAAPLMIIRLWCHCQQRRASKFKNMSAIALAGICRWQKNPEEILAILKDCGFIEVRNDVTTVHDWEEINASLIVRWKGGENNRRRLLGKPKLTSSLPHRLAGSDKSRVDKIREERSGEERNLKSSTQADNPPLSVPEKEREKVSLLNRIRAFFHKRQSTPLDDSERRAWEKAQPAVTATQPEEWKLLEWAYSQSGGDAGRYRRHDMATLLNNWDCEIDRARGWKNGSPSSKDEYELKGYDKYTKEKY